MTIGFFGVFCEVGEVVEGKNVGIGWGMLFGRFCVGLSWFWFKYLNCAGKLDIDRTEVIYIEGMNVHCLLSWNIDLFLSY